MATNNAPTCQGSFCNVVVKGEHRNENSEWVHRITDEWYCSDCSFPRRDELEEEGRTEAASFDAPDFYGWEEI